MTLGSKSFADVNGLLPWLISFMQMLEQAIPAYIAAWNAAQTIGDKGAALGQLITTVSAALNNCPLLTSAGSGAQEETKKFALSLATPEAAADPNGILSGILGKLGPIGQKLGPLLPVILQTITDFSGGNTSAGVQDILKLIQEILGNTTTVTPTGQMELKTIDVSSRAV